MSSKPKRLPGSVAQWRKLALEWNTTGGMDELGSPVKVSSASKFDYERFLGLQVLYDFPKPQSTIPIAITGQFPSIPGFRLENVPGYDSYLNQIDRSLKNGISPESIANTRVSGSLGAFVNVWQLQRHVLVGDENATDVSKVSEVLPTSAVAERTRAKVRSRRLEQAATPTPAPRAKNIPLLERTARLTLTNEGGIGDQGFNTPMSQATDALDDESAKYGEFSSDDDDNGDSDDVDDDNDDADDVDDDDDEDGKNYPGMLLPTFSSREQDRPCGL